MVILNPMKYTGHIRCEVPKHMCIWLHQYVHINILFYINQRQCAKIRKTARCEYPTKNLIKFAPFLYHKSTNWVWCFFCCNLVLMLLTKFVPNSTIKVAVNANIVYIVVKTVPALKYSIVWLGIWGTG